MYYWSTFNQFLYTFKPIEIQGNYNKEVFKENLIWRFVTSIKKHIEQKHPNVDYDHFWLNEESKERGQRKLKIANWFSTMRYFRYLIIFILVFSTAFLCMMVYRYYQILH